MSHHCGKGLLGCAAWLLTSLAAVHLGLSYFKGWNILDSFIQMFPASSMPTVAAVTYGLIGVAGVVSLLFWVKCLMHRHEECHTDRR